MIFSWILKIKSCTKCSIINNYQCKIDRWLMRIRWMINVHNEYHDNYFSADAFGFYRFLPRSFPLWWGSQIWPLKIWLKLSRIGFKKSVCVKILFNFVTSKNTGLATIVTIFFAKIFYLMSIDCQQIKWKKLTLVELLFNKL